MNNPNFGRFLGILLLVLAIALAIVPQFTDCESQGNMITLANGKEISMKCHWTAQAEIVLAVPVAIIGSMMIISPNRRKDFGIGALVLALGILPILTATNIIGTCVNPTMFCNVAMKPSLLVIGGLITATGLVSLASAWYSRRNN